MNNNDALDLYKLDSNRIEFEKQFDEIRLTPQCWGGWHKAQGNSHLLQSIGPSNPSSLQSNTTSPFSRLFNWETFLQALLLNHGLYIRHKHKTFASTKPNRLCTMCYVCMLTVQWHRDNMPASASQPSGQVSREAALQNDLSPWFPQCPSCFTQALWMSSEHSMVCTHTHAHTNVHTHKHFERFLAFLWWHLDTHKTTTTNKPGHVQRSRNDSKPN